jgi:uncharacterized protein (DUF4415 family)
MRSRTDQHEQEVAALAQLRDEDIDTSDIPEVRDWSGAAVGKFYRPIKESVTLRIDVDVLAWLKAEGPGYQTRINTFLREVMQRRLPRRSTREVPDSKLTNRHLRFPSLEKHGELERFTQIADVIEARQCVFAPAQ